MTAWQQKLGGVLFAILTFELGVALIVFPWLDHWAVNYFALITPESYEQATWYEWWRRVWNSGYFRGAISGIGIVNLYVSIVAVSQLRRFASRESEQPGR
jgi:polyphosphate kinase 2 (PPK2 family)